jgi:membrane-anchored glycerophosphoryl diester phosphodiesterase (GDPDase)
MALKSQAITDADRRNIHRPHAETEEIQAQTIAWFALVEASLCCFILQLRTILALPNLVL